MHARHGPSRGKNIYGWKIYRLIFPTSLSSYAAGIKQWIRPGTPGTGLITMNARTTERTSDKAMDMVHEGNLP
jgi:hypothetical protein